MHQKRRSWAGVALAAGLATLLAACSSSATPAASPDSTSSGSAAASESAATPVEGGTLTYAIEAKPTSANPQLAGAWYLENAYQTYLQRNSDGTYSPSLVESWEVSDDNLVYTFTLKDGITFHDGAPLDADAVLFNFEKIQDPEYLTSQPVGLEHVTEIAKVDDLTFSITLDQVDVLLIDFLSGYGSSPLSPASFDSSDLEAGGPGLAGTGPFVVTEFVPNQVLTLEKYADYDWAPERAEHEGAAYLDEVVFNFVPEGSTRVGNLESGQVDAIEGLPGTDYDRILGNSDLTVETAYNPGRPYGILFNTSNAPTDDVRVRTAIRDGFDLDAILTAVYQGHRERAYYWESTVNFSYTDEFDGTWGNDIEGAKALLDEAGWTGTDSEGYRTNAAGERLSIQAFLDSQYLRDSRDTVQLAIAEQLRTNLGIEYKVEVVDIGTGTEKRAANLHNIFENSYATTDFAATTRTFITGFGTPNTDPKVAEFDAAGRATNDLAERTEIYHEFFEYFVLEQAYWVPLYYVQQDTAYQNYLEGVYIDEGKGRIGTAYDIWINK